MRCFLPLGPSAQTHWKWSDKVQELCTQKQPKSIPGIRTPNTESGILTLWTVVKRGIEPVG